MPPPFTNFTYLFEIVMPSDRKVVNYSFSGLVVLGFVHETGSEFGPAEVHWLEGSRKANSIPYEDLEKLQQKDLPNEEGVTSRCGIMVHLPKE